MSSRRLVRFALLLSVAAKAEAFQPLRAPVDISLNGWKALRPAVVARPYSLADTCTKNNVLLASSDDVSSEGTSSDGQKTRSINDLLNELGLSFKIRAEENISKSKEATTRGKRLIYSIVSVGYFIMFLFYRAYRGFFVLLPAVFRRVYSKLETTVETDLSLEDGQEVTSSVRSPSWKTKVTVSVLAMVVTCSYVIGGVSRIVSKFVRTVGKTSSVSESFGAAAKEAVDHEDRIRRRMSLSEEGESTLDESSPKNDGLSP
jgi:hypothetical protein